MTAVEIFVRNVTEAIINPIIGLLFVSAVVVFAWGIAMFILNAGDPEKRKKGKDILIWGVIGIFIMTAVYGILNIGINTFFPDGSVRIPTY